MFKDEHSHSARVGLRVSPTRAILGAALALALLLMLAVPARAASDLLPDLVAEAPYDAQTPAVMQLADGNNHLLLKFGGAIHNAGAGALDIRGSNNVGGVMTVTGQRIYRDDGSFFDDTSRHPIIRYENSDGHDHWHLMNAARWSLWNQAGTAQVAPAAKVGFCLEDGSAVDPFAVTTPAYTSTQTDHCMRGQPNATSVFEGISSGWHDVYGSNVYFQWIDISDVVPGLYRLGSQMDPDDFVRESNEANNGPTVSSSPVTVPGYVAAPVSAAITGKQSVTLAAQQFGIPGPRQFTIVSGPGHGSLNFAAGAPFSGPTVTYSPSADYSGSDRFSFIAFDSASPYPLHPAVATASLSVTAPPVALFGHLRFSRAGRLLFARARAKRSGRLRMVVKKRKHRIGSCRKRIRSRHRFTCKIKLRKRSSPARAVVTTSLRAGGKLITGKTYRVPRHVRRAHKRRH
jgi:hypothetical protein